jgi:SAM-dependent methyltransferase
MLDAERSSIERFMRFAGKEIPKGARVLDAGAGSRPYARFFVHTRYESTDFADIFDQQSKHKHDFLCSLEKIPRKNDTYDAIINTQVLEHVEYPEKVIKEFYRVLKPGGKLFLTAPQGWGIHGEPYHFFNFTSYGLASLFKRAGFTILSIKPRGGIFKYIGKRIRTLPNYIYAQYVLDKEKRKRITLAGCLLFPFYLLAIPLCRWFTPLLCNVLDPLDKKRDYTLGYACYCIKEP